MWRRRRPTGLQTVITSEASRERCRVIELEGGNASLLLYSFHYPRYTP